MISKATVGKKLWLKASMGDLLGYYVIHWANICKVKPALNAKNNCVKKYGKQVCGELMNSPKNASYYKTELLLELARKKTQGLSILKCRLLKSLVGENAIRTALQAS